jgi:CubicO group peptidase (beta-lactamase class C family)
MLLERGGLGRERIISPASVAVMTTDHLTLANKAVPAMVPGFWDDHGYGFGVSVQTRRSNIAHSVGTYGWDGGLGTSWYNDPAEDMQAILLTQAAWTSPTPPALFRDFWTCAWAAIED